MLTKLPWLLLAVALTAVGSLAAQQPVLDAEAENLAWIMAISEPEHIGGPIAQEQQATFERQVMGIIRNPELERLHGLPEAASAQQPAALSLDEVIAVATAYRLRGDAVEAARWYGVARSLSDDPRHAYFEAQALRRTRALAAVE